MIENQGRAVFKLIDSLKPLLSLRPEAKAQAEPMPGGLSRSDAPEKRAGKKSARFCRASARLR
jgi:hypothetical protein